ncbi:DNA replication licensing factor mcm4 [Ceratobasidium theobromae]|uniref:DNA replication licensing factor MCM4 n=1 Tax=Ceratobasidium theobromae TaxID=1582974 RepID=A0A5N5QAB5_9AGAM|nr:DNA replication licensing factor mcm4 [Ceratobasidium theobromae]
MVLSYLILLTKQHASNLAREDQLNLPSATMSSPLAFPPSEGDTPRASRRTPLFNPATPATPAGVATPGSVRFDDAFLASSPLAFPDGSSPARQAETPRRLFRPSSEPPSAGPTPRSARQRSDLRSTAARNTIRRSHANQTPSTPGGDDRIAFPSSSAAPSNPTLSAQALPSADDTVERLAWGSTITHHEVFHAFSDFLRNYKAKYRTVFDRERRVPTRPVARASDGERLVYQGYLKTMLLTDQYQLNLDLIDLQAYAPTKKLHNALIKFPQEVVPMLDQCLADAIEELTQTQGMDTDRDQLDVVYKVRPFISDNVVNMRELNPSDTDKLVAIKGLVIRATPIIPDMSEAFFRCVICHHTLQVQIDRGRINEPDRCPRQVCASPGSMILIHNRSTFADRQIVRLQETPDVVPAGQTPHTVSLGCYDELVDVGKPGDRVIATGIFRAVPVRANPRQRAVKALFRTYLDVLHIQRGSPTRLGVDVSTREEGEGRVGAMGVGGEDEDEVGLAVDAEREGAEEDETRAKQLEATLKEISERPDVYELLARSLAPSIWELEDVKKGILLQLFGGTNKSVARGGGGGGPRYRGDINVLLVGDPGTSKSQILQYVHKIAPRGVYTSGKGSSAVGTLRSTYIFFCITNDADNFSGALVLSDGGVCCIDEFDKMSDATRSVLHEVMEQQTVSIAKAGIITTLNARTSILAAANPVQSKYNPKWPITRNIDLPPTLISRFDLVYLVLDNIDESTDRRLAQHLVGLYLEDRPESAATDIIPIETLTAYISYARRKIQPRLTEEAGNELVSEYVALRKLGADARSSERRITATTRQLESMIRLSEAHARMRFSQLVELEDVKEACRLMREALRMSATDPTTGLLDMDLINTGSGAGQRRARADLKREVTRLASELGAGGTRAVKWAELQRELGKQSSVGVEASEFSEVVRALEAEGAVRIAGERERRTIQLVGGAA